MATDLLLDPDVIDAVLAVALAQGADFAEIFVEDTRSTTTTMDQRRVEDLMSNRSRGAGVRVIVGSTTGYAHTADLSLSGLIAAAEAARSVAQRPSGGATVVAVGAPQVHAMRALIEPSGVDRSQRIDILRTADDIARSHGGAISQVQLSIADNSRRILVANSRGLLTTDHQVRSRLNVSCVASGDTGMQTGRATLAATAGFELFAPERVAQTAANAARQAITKMSARPAPSGDFPIVLANGFGGVLFHEACGHGLEADAIVKKIRKATTDPLPLPSSKDELKDRPEAENLLNIYAALADQDRDTVITQFAGQQFSGFKQALADLTVSKLEPINSQMRRLLADPGEIDRILKDGAHRARAIATPIMDEVKKRVGFIT